ncbi:TPA: cell division inhibition protein DicB [Escherichia coli]|nr:cell division inhibition protein DicB [Escherichia coli]
MLARLRLMPKGCTQ